jgi:hypothetical protein
MMDDRSVELASRLVDGDLEPDAAARLEDRARSDAELAALIESFRALRRAVGEVADDMAPPAELDAVVEPLGRAPASTTGRVRPVYRWLGAAAAAVLAVTVVVEMTRRNPGPTVPRRPAPEHTTDADEGVFELSPLPSAATGGDGRRPIGAADRLLAEEPLPPDAPEPTTLEVVGPLQEAHDHTPTAARETSPTGSGKRTAGRRAPPKADTAVADAAGARHEQENAVPARPEAAAGKGPARRSAAALDGSAIDAPRSPGARLVVAGETVWEGRLEGCDPGRYWLIVEVRDGRVVAVTYGAAEADRPSDAPAGTDGLIGVPAGGLVDGEHAADLVVGPAP